MIDWVHFTPWASLSGGILLGLSAVLLILLCGRILGISGIVAGLFTPQAGDAGWRLTFLAGMLAAPWLAAQWMPSLLQIPRIDASWTLLVVSGLLVGFGAQCGSGCTSGHGVCGLSRLSPRSLVATLTFMAAGGVTVFLVRHFFP